jgi:hypothetical protein
VAGRFPLYTDADVDGPVVKALRAAAWDVLRGIDAYPERTRDHIHFARAAQERRVLVSNDIDMKAIAEAWFLEGRSFPGLVWWPRRHYETMSPGDFVAAFEELAGEDDAFAGYPIVHIKPKR